MLRLPSGQARFEIIADENVTREQSVRPQGSRLLTDTHF